MIKLISHIPYPTAKKFIHSVWRTKLTLETTVAKLPHTLQELFERYNVDLSKPILVFSNDQEMSVLVLRYSLFVTQTHQFFYSIHNSMRHYNVIANLNPSNIVGMTVEEFIEVLDKDERSKVKLLTYYEDLKNRRIVE